jgi:hypothetical protein
VVPPRARLIETKGFRSRDASAIRAYSAILAGLVAAGATPQRAKNAGCDIETLQKLAAGMASKVGEQKMLPDIPVARLPFRMLPPGTWGVQDVIDHYLRQRSQMSAAQAERFDEDRLRLVFKFFEPRKCSNSEVEFKVTHVRDWIGRIRQALRDVALNAVELLHRESDPKGYILGDQTDYCEL